MPYFWLMEKEWKARWLILTPLLCFQLFTHAQRTYTENSVLSSGNWYKISTTTPGVYKIDLPFLNKLGISTTNLPSNTIRLFGNGGGMLPEDCKTSVPDDLQENAIMVVDGNDGILNGSDYLLFYSEGPHKWVPDSANKTFRHQHNIYSNEAYYFLTVGGQGKRIQPAIQPPSFNREAVDYQHLYYYELDTFNLLSSGKEWYGEEFASGPGKSTIRLFRLPEEIKNLASTALLRLSAVARAFGSSSTFTASIAGNQILKADIPAVATGPYDVFAREVSADGQSIVPPGSQDLRIDFQPGSDNAQGWLDWFELIFPATLRYDDRQFSFRNWNVTGPLNIARFSIQTSKSSLQIWNISSRMTPLLVATSVATGGQSFNYDCSSLQQFQAFTLESAYIPNAKGRVANQNLHRPDLYDYLVVCHPALLSEANRLATFHRQKNGLKASVVTTEQVYNEFSSGIPDPAAIRNYVKMFYDRSGGDSTRVPRYLALFGDGSFDYKERINQNTNLVPVFESANSLEPLLTYTSDDFFGMLADDADINNPVASLLAIGVGRIPARNQAEAKSYVDKVIAYYNPAALGAWRTEYTLVADDEDNNLHLDDAESVSATVTEILPGVNIEKIYLDAFQQLSGSGGGTYPEVNQLVNSRMYSGNLIWNYNGHGGYRRLAEETVLDQSIINQITNEYRLPLFITATCDVAPYDNPLLHSIGENLLLKPKTGAIALMTTTRLVFAFSNRVMNNNYLRIAMKRKADGTYMSLGEAVKIAKNFTYQFSGDHINNRKFTLLGDPALTIAFPKDVLRVTTVNGKPLSAIPDTLKALSRYIIGGEVLKPDGTLRTDFNGTVQASIFDKPSKVTTLANDPSSLKTTFEEQKNYLFKGKAKVTGGIFSLEFIVPQDINYQFGNGKISLYADNGIDDAAGVLNEVIVGGSSGSIDDQDGPDIRAFLNDEKFVSGGITNENPVLLVKLFDSSGINISGSGVGHDLIAYLDNDPSRSFVLNDFYEGEVDNYRKGVVRYPLPPLADGVHTLTIKAWDIANNSSEAAIDFRIVKSESLTLSNVVNYPNPFTTRTSFWFEHNRPGDELNVSVQVFTITGKLVKTLRSTIITTGNRSFEVEWDGTDEWGGKIGRGVYIYSLKVQSSDGRSAHKVEKLYKL